MKNKYKSYITKFLIFLIIVMAFLIYIRPKNFDDLIGTSDMNITKIILTSGTSGEKVVVTDKEQIQKLINLVNNRHYYRSLNQFTSTSGWGYCIEFFEGNTYLIQLTYSGDKRMYVNYTHYRVDSPISYEETDKIFKSLPNKIKPWFLHNIAFFRHKNNSFIVSFWTVNYYPLINHIDIYL